MPQRMNGGLVVAAIGGAMLIVSLFLDWFAPGRSAWTVFELNDLVLLALGALALGIALADLASPSERKSHVAEGSVLYAGIGALIIVVATLIQPPPGALHSSREIGAWLGLAGAALITTGGILLRARISLVITLRSTDRRRSRPAEEVYEPETYEPASEVDPQTETQRFEEPPG